MEPLTPYTPADLIINYGQVDSRLYRGAQPTLAAYPVLATMGIGTIINLRKDPLPMEAATVLKLGMYYISCPLHKFFRPSRPTVNAILDNIIQNTRGAGTGSTFVHCERGRDRTGMIVACYRIKVCGWTHEQAQAEANQYHMSGLEWFMREFVEDYAA